MVVNPYEAPARRTSELSPSIRRPFLPTLLRGARYGAGVTLLVSFMLVATVNRGAMAMAFVDDPANSGWWGMVLLGGTILVVAGGGALVGGLMAGAWHRLREWL